MQPKYSELPGVCGLFPGGSGIATETLNCFVIYIFHVPLSHVSFLPYLQIMRKKPKPEEPIAQRRTKARHDPKTLEIVEETLRRESSQQRTKGRHDPKPQQLESVHEEKESQEASDGEEDDVSDPQFEMVHMCHGKGPMQ